MSFTFLPKARLSCDRSFIVLTTVSTIINYDSKSLIVEIHDCNDSGQNFKTTIIAEAR